MQPHTKPPDLSDYPVVIALPIQWGDQDAFGHVNNAVHITWFESARVAYLERAGLPLVTPGSGIAPILASITCNYRRQLEYPDTVHIGARISRIGRSSMTMEHAVYSDALAVLVADGNSVVVAFDYGSNQPAPVPDEVRRAVETLEGRAV